MGKRFADVEHHGKHRALEGGQNSQLGGDADVIDAVERPEQSEPQTLEYCSVLWDAGTE